MNENTPVAPPTEPPQWTLDDLAAAKRHGRPDLITLAMNSGQLRDVLAMPDTQPDPQPGRRSAPLSDKDIDRLKRKFNTTTSTTEN